MTWDCQVLLIGSTQPVNRRKDHTSFMATSFYERYEPKVGSVSQGPKYPNREYILNTILKDSQFRSHIYPHI